MSKVKSHIVLTAATVAVIGLGGCSMRGMASNMPTDALDHAIGDAVGDPTTCVIIAERTTRKTIYTYGESSNCARELPACDRPGTLSANKALALADKPDDRGASCPSNDDGSRRVGWAEGRVNSKRGNWIYSAMMEGEKTLPGQEILARLALAFKKAGL